MNQKILNTDQKLFFKMSNWCINLFVICAKLNPNIKNGINFLAIWYMYTNY